MFRFSNPIQTDPPLQPISAEKLTLQQTPLNISCKTSHGHDGNGNFIRDREERNAVNYNAAERSHRGGESEQTARELEFS